MISFGEELSCWFEFSEYVGDENVDSVSGGEVGPCVEGWDCAVDLSVCESEKEFMTESAGEM